MNTTQVWPTLRSVVGQLPPHGFTTDELLQAAGQRFSPKLRHMLANLGVEKRYSVLKNYPAVLFDQAEPELGISGSTLAVQAARACLEKGGVNARDIGLVLGVTSSPSRLLPSMVCDMFAQ